MAEPKKISFGFTKINKKPLISLQKKEEKEIQFIDCLEGNSIKIVNGDEKIKELPIIPLRNGNILRDNMIEALKARKGKIDILGSKDNVESECCKTDVRNTNLTLDELAAKEILEDLKKVKEVEEFQEELTVPQAEAVRVSEKESTLEDYDSMPVNQFGLAVLRGMGWAPDKGIGKNAQIIKPINPALRPKGMGLGADKVIHKPVTESKERLDMKKSALLKVISGPYKGFYGKIEGFDDLPGRMIVRLTLKNVVISISENLVVLVTESEYNKNSKILNLNEYNNFHDEKLDVTNKIKKNAVENKNLSDNDFENKVQYSPEDGRKYKKEDQNTEYNKRVDQKASTSTSDKRYRKYTNTQKESNSTDFDLDNRLKYKPSNYKYRNSNQESTKHSKDRTIEIDSSDSDSSLDKKISKSKKHRRCILKHGSSSRSKSGSSKKKKKRSRHRSRS